MRSKRTTKTKQDDKKGQTSGMSKTKLLLGAAGLFLFIVGAKRSFRVDEPDGAVPQNGPDKVHGDPLEPVVTASGAASPAA